MVGSATCAYGCVVARRRPQRAPHQPCRAALGRCCCCANASASLQPGGVSGRAPCCSGLAINGTRRALVGWLATSVPDRQAGARSLLHHRLKRCGARPRSSHQAPACWYHARQPDTCMRMASCARSPAALPQRPRSTLAHPVCHAAYRQRLAAPRQPRQQGVRALWPACCFAGSRLCLPAAAGGWAAQGRGGRCALHGPGNHSTCSSAFAACPSPGPVQSPPHASVQHSKPGICRSSSLGGTGMLGGAVCWPRCRSAAHRRRQASAARGASRAPAATAAAPEDSGVTVRARAGGWGLASAAWSLQTRGGRRRAGRRDGIPHLV